VGHLLFYPLLKTPSSDPGLSAPHQNRMMCRKSPAHILSALLWIEQRHISKVMKTLVLMHLTIYQVKKNSTSKK
jgi:hypothetical protein